jgi:hypothetical protein
MPAWLAREIMRATAPHQPAAPAVHFQPGAGAGPAAYLTTVINRGTIQLAAMTDGRKRALSALAYHAGGLLDWSGLDRQEVASLLITAGTTSGLPPAASARIVGRAIANGTNCPVTPPRSRS